MEFKDMLLYYRKLYGYTQAQLGKKIGVTASAIGMYEQGRRTPDFEIEEALADAFNVNLDTLRGKETIKPQIDEKDARIKRLLSYATMLNDANFKKLEERAEELSTLQGIKKKEDICG